jgi:hypothetical protein
MGSRSIYEKKKKEELGVIGLTPGFAWAKASRFSVDWGEEDLG